MKFLYSLLTLVTCSEGKPLWDKWSRVAGTWLSFTGAGWSDPCSQGLPSSWGAVPVPVPPQVTHLCGVANCHQFVCIHSPAVNCWGRGLHFRSVQLRWLTRWLLFHSSQLWEMMISSAATASSGRVCGELVFMKQLQWRNSLLINPVANTKVTPVRLIMWASLGLDAGTKMSRSAAVNRQDGYSFYSGLIKALRLKMLTCHVWLKSPKVMSKNPQILQTVQKSGI